jgi:hypothetical protein
MNKVLGYFVFQQVGDGCLLAKYSNWTLRSPLTEAAKLTPMDQTVEAFVGQYFSTWIDNPALGDPFQQTDRAVLKIQRKQGTTGIFTLLWDNGQKFSGEGMLFNNLLVGSYWNPDLYNGPTDLFLP